MPTKCVAHDKNPPSDSRTSDHFHPLNEVTAEAENRRLFHLLPIETDTHRERPRDPYEGRELQAGEALLYGCHIPSEEFVSDEASRSPCVASRELITKSQKLIAASKQRVRRIKADMVLRCFPGEKIN